MDFQISATHSLFTGDGYGVSLALSKSRMRMRDAEDSVPLVSLLVCGGIGCLRLCLDHLRRQLPLLVLEGSGGLADLLAFAYRQVQRR